MATITRLREFVTVTEGDTKVAFTYKEWNEAARRHFRLATGKYGKRR